MRCVLVALDGSELAETVLPVVTRLARPLGLEVVLLHVVPGIPHQALEATRRVLDNAQRMREESVEYLEGVAGRLRADELTVTTAVRQGDAATEILEGAREAKADIIAMTTHGRTGLGRLFYGSVAEDVLKRADIPVFLVRAADVASVHDAA
jgi:nucleotide-binding universal stress UspA family protein